MWENNIKKLGNMEIQNQPKDIPDKREIKIIRKKRSRHNFMTRQANTIYHQHRIVMELKEKLGLLQKTIENIDAKISSIEQNLFRDSKRQHLNNLLESIINKEGDSVTLTIPQIKIELHNSIFENSIQSETSDSDTNSIRMENDICTI